MANTIKIRRSATASAVPTTAQLSLGELAINTYDGKLFLKKSVSGVETIVEVGASSGGVTSFNTRTGAVTLSSGDVTGALTYTPLSNAGGTLTGGLTFSGNGLRIQGDFSNATLANRLWFQTSTSNGATSVFAVPNGTSDTSGWTAFGGSDPANAALAQLLATSTEISVRAGKNGTGTYNPLAFYVNNAKAFQIGTAGQWGIGTTPDYGTSGQVLTSGGASAAPTWTTLNYAATNQTMYIGTTAVAINRTSGLLALTGVSIDGSAGSATNATNTAVTNDTTTATAQYVTFVGGTSGNVSQKIHSTGLTFVPSTGSLTASGNITAYSDETLKTNWRALPRDFIERLAHVRSGIYDRTDMEATQVGVSAQSLQWVLEHAVNKGADGKLSVAYGNAAMVSAVALAERVVDLERRLASLEATKKDSGDDLTSH